MKVLKPFGWFLLTMAIALGAAVFTKEAVGQTVSTVQGPTINEYWGSTKLGSFKDFASCVADAKTQSPGTYACQGVVVVKNVLQWNKIATEKSPFTLKTTSDSVGFNVRYGSGATFITKLLPAGTYSCDNNLFTDPLFGVVKECDVEYKQTPFPPPPNVPAPPVAHMHAGVQGIDISNPIVASFDGLGLQKGVNTVMLSPLGDPLQSPATEEDWERSGAIRTVCKGSHMSNDDGLVYPGQPGLAHTHTFFRPGTDAFITDQNVRADGAFSTCRGGTLDLTARWVPTAYDKTSMRAIVPHVLLMYYKEDCEYDIACSGYTDYRTMVPDNVHFVPKGLHLIAGDPAATAPTGVAHFTCLVNALGNGRPGFENQDTIPKCASDGSEALWMSVDLPECLAVNDDGTPVLDSPNHKSHAAYKEGWPTWDSPNPGKAYRCPLDHPYEITKISFKVIYEILPGMDTSTWGLSCGPDYCMHADWFDGWDHTIMDKTSDECLAKRRDCGTFRIFDGRTALEFQGN